MVTLRNIGKKIVGINGAIVMPDDTIELEDSFAELPSIQALVRVGQVAVEKQSKKAKQPEAKDEPVPEADKTEEPVVEKPAPKKSSRKKKTEEEDTKAYEEQLAKDIFQ